MLQKTRYKKRPSNTNIIMIRVRANRLPGRKEKMVLLYGTVWNNVDERKKMTAENKIYKRH